MISSGLDVISSTPNFQFGEIFYIFYIFHYIFYIFITFLPFLAPLLI